jgi:hypothetical protein
MKIDGCCHCGRISYEADINPDYVVICHCTDCQTISGSPYRVTVPVKTENFKLRGQPKTYVKTAASGNKRVLAFCADCGSAIYSTSLEDRRVFSLRLGAVKQRAQLIPKSQGAALHCPGPWISAAFRGYPTQPLSCSLSAQMRIAGWL